MASAQNVSLKQIVALSEMVGLLVDRIMEPNSLAMVVGITKNVLFTKLTSKVLSEVELQHPLQKIIYDAAFLYSLETGDDSKVFLLLFRGIMKGIEDMLKDSNEIEVRRTILKQICNLRSILPDIFKSIFNTYALFSRINFSALPKDVEGLIFTFFDSKFSANISTKLSHLMCDFLSRSISDSSQAMDALTYFISNYDTFCTKVIAPFSNSKVVEGFLLHNRLSPFLIHKMVYFVVILNLPCKSDDAVWETDESFSLKLKGFWKQVNNALKHLKSMEISLILTEKGICNDFESLCSQNGILIVNRVSKEDIDNILHLVNIFPMNDLYDSIDPQNVGCLESLTSLVVASTSFTQLKSSVHNHPYLIPHHIFLCASLEEVLKDYYSECLNCLKAVKQWLQPINKKSFHEEKLPNFFKIQKFLGHFDQLLNDSKPVISSESVMPAYSLGVAFPIGLFEFALKNILTNFCKDVSVKKFCDILNSALLNVIHKLWNTPKLVVIDEKNYIEFQKKIIHRIAVPIEPASSKENLLYKVLQLVEQLVKIDAILSRR